MQLSDESTAQLTAQTGELAAAIAKLATSNMSANATEIPDISELMNQLTAGVKSPALA